MLSFRTRKHAFEGICSVLLYCQSQLPKRTHYQNLDLSPDSSFKAIRSAYLQKIKTLHPDKQQSLSSQHFNCVKESYTVLRQAASRKRYDMSLGIMHSQWQLTSTALDFEDARLYQELQQLERTTHARVDEDHMQAFYSRVGEIPWRDYFKVCTVPFLMVCSMQVFWTMVVFIVLNDRGEERVSIGVMRSDKKSTMFPIYRA